jgi:hypothetical protein
MSCAEVACIIHPISRSHIIRLRTGRYFKKSRVLMNIRRAVVLAKIPVNHIVTWLTCVRLSIVKEKPGGT